MKKRSAVIIVIIFMIAFILGADLSVFDLHLRGKARRALNNVLPDNTMQIIMSTNNSANDNEEIYSPDPFLEADASAYESDNDRAWAMYYALRDRLRYGYSYTYRMEMFYSNQEDKDNQALMGTLCTMYDFFITVLDDIRATELNNTYDNSKAIMAEVRYIRDYLTRTCMDIYMGADITSETFKEYAEQYEAGMSLTEILE